MGCSSSSSAARTDSFERVPASTQYLPPPSSVGSTTKQRETKGDSSIVVNSLFHSPSPCDKRISVELSELSILGNKGRISSEFSMQLRESLTGSRVSASAEAGSKHVVIYGNDGGQPLVLRKLIGRGGYGCVFVGEWDNKEVAVKVVAGRTTDCLDVEGQKQECRRQKMAQLEAILMAVVDHENIVSTYKVMCGSDAPPQSDDPTCDQDMGESFDERAYGNTAVSFYIIMENARYGSLWSGLVVGRFHVEVPDIVGPSAGLVMWDAWAALETMKEIVRGLLYLHEQGVLHGDFKAANVLLCKKAGKDRRGFIAKVTDFGFSRIASTEGDALNFMMRTNTYGTVTHMPPELLAEGLLTASADVYAIGTIMWEIYTARVVFQDMTDAEVITRVVDSKLRPEFPFDTPSSFKKLAQSCWSKNHWERPSLRSVLDQLSAIQDELCPLGPASPGTIISGSAPQNRRKSLQEPAAAVAKLKVARRGSLDIGVEASAAAAAGPSHHQHRAGASKAAAGVGAWGESEQSGNPFVARAVPGGEYSGMTQDLRVDVETAGYAKSRLQGTSYAPSRLYQSGTTAWI